MQHFAFTTLIITIIVLLILAGVTLNMVMGESGIINKAQSAKLKTNENSAQEVLKMQIIDYKTSIANTNKNPTLQDFKEYCNNNGNNTIEYININENEAKVKLKGYNYEITLNEKLKISKVEEKKEIVYDDWKILASKIGIESSNYNSLEEFFEDSQLYDKILGNKESVEYLIESEKEIFNIITTKKEFLEKTIHSEYLINFINNPKWYEVLKESGVLLEKENELIPVLTSENESQELEEGQCYAEAYYSGYEAHKAFDKNLSTAWYLDNTCGYTTFPNLYYNFGKETCIYGLYANLVNPTRSYSDNKFIISVSDDNIEYKEIFNKEWIWNQQLNACMEINEVLDKPIKCKYIKIYSELAASTYLPYSLTQICKEIQFFGVN